LPEEIEVVALSLPGRGSRLHDPLEENMDELVKHIILNFAPYFDKPFVFFGHSMGAVMAFEVARQLQYNGHSLPWHLFVSARVAPHLAHDGPSLIGLSRTELLQRICELGLVPTEVLHHEALVDLILPPLQADSALIEHYRWDQQEPLTVPITALGAHDDSVARVSQIELWKQCTTASFTMRIFEGGHFYIQAHQDEVLAFIAQTFETTIAPKSMRCDEQLPYPELLTLSAKTADSLEQLRLNLINYLEKHPLRDVAPSREAVRTSLTDVAYTLHVGWEALDHRLAVTCTDMPSAIQALKQAGTKPYLVKDKTKNAPIVFMFPGGGVQYAQMGLGLYKRIPTFRQHVDECRVRLMPLIEQDLGELLYFGENAPSGEALKEILYFQLSIFVVEYALARTLIDWGIQPTALVGHSLGEYVAASLSGILTLDDALQLVVQRSISMDACTTEGAMLAAKMSARQGMEVLEKRAKEAPPETRDAVIGLSLINSPTSVVFGGEREAIGELEQQLRQLNVKCRLLNTPNRASHSPLQHEAAMILNQKVQDIQLSPASIPMTLNLTGEWLAEGQSLAPTYWGQQLTNTVRFEENIRQMCKLSPAFVLEVGPKRTLSRIVKDVLHDSPEFKKNSMLILPTMRHPLDTGTTDEAFLWQTLGQLWCAGASYDWQALYARYSVAPTLNLTLINRLKLSPPPAPQLGPSYQAFEPQSNEKLSQPSAILNQPPVNPSARESLQRCVCQEIAQILGLHSAADIDVDSIFFDLGLDSLSSLDLRTRLQKRFNHELPANLIFKYPTVNALVDYLAKQMA
jgi:acyl transferase domain-containing protein